MKGVIILFKHTTFLRLSNSSPKLALAHAELDYKKANINKKIKKHLKESTQQHFVEKSADFIMSTNISVFIFASVTGRSYLIKLLEHSQPLFETSMHPSKWFWPFENYGGRSQLEESIRRLEVEPSGSGIVGIQSDVWGEERQEERYRNVIDEV